MQRDSGLGLEAIETCAGVASVWGRLRAIPIADNSNSVRRDHRPIAVPACATRLPAVSRIDVRGHGQSLVYGELRDSCVLWKPAALNSIQIISASTRPPKPSP